MNMFKKIEASSIKEYLAKVPEERQKDIEFLHEFIQNISPKFKSHFAYNMLGYGKFPYVNYKKESISWPIVALASQKNYMSLYVCALDGKWYLVEKYKKDLGKVSVGKSCIRFKKLGDLNLPVLKKSTTPGGEKSGTGEEIV